MDGVLLAGRLVLALVFVVAGLSKLADLPGSRRAIREFGLPEALAAPIGYLLPLVEIAVAVCLIPTRTAWIASIVAGGLLLLFTLAIGVNLARGRKPDCHCFGQVASGPIGASTLVRNVVLVAIAAFVAVAAPIHGNSGTSALDWLTKLSNGEKVGLIFAGVLTALLIAQWGFLLNLLRQNGRLLERMEVLENGVTALRASGVQGALPAAAAQEPVIPQQPVYGLPVGTPAPAFALSGLYGEVQTLDSLRARDLPVFLMFTDPNCGPCGDLLPDIANWQREYDSRLTVALVSRGAADANKAKTSAHGVRNVLLQNNDEVAEAFLSPGTPSAVMVQPDGTIGTPMSAGAEGIRSLMVSLMGTAQVPSGPPIPLLEEMPTNLPAPSGGNGSQPSAQPVAAGVGQPTPALQLKDLDNKSWDLSQLRGDKSVLIFWNLGCGFCQQMLPDLKEWEKTKPADAPRVILISSGSVEDNRAMGLRSTVLLDQNFQAGQAFGAQGTPMGVIIDTNGNIASDVAAGAPGVWGLVGGGPAGAGAPAGGAAAPVGNLKAGDSAPALTFPDINGKTVNLKELGGTNTLLLFWSNGCGFCQQMLPDLRTWEQNKPRGAPQLIVVSRGSADENRALGLQSTIVLDDNFQAGSAFGAGGTPMAVLIDAKGNVASEVAAGAEQCFALAAASAEGAKPVS